MLIQGSDNKSVEQYKTFHLNDIIKFKKKEFFFYFFCTKVDKKNIENSRFYKTIFNVYDKFLPSMGPSFLCATADCPA